MTEFTKDELQTLKNAVERSYSERPYKDWHPQAKELFCKLQSMIDNYRDPNCIHEIDKQLKACKLCGLPSHSIPCVGGWL